MTNIIKKFMKVLVVLTLCFTLCSCLLFNKSTSVDAASNLVDIKNDAGSTIKYNGSNETVKRLNEYDYPTQDLRATWISNLIGSMPRYTSESQWKAEYNKVLDRLQEYGLNTAIFHVRTHNNALYPSSLNPVASWLSTVNFTEFDPLEWMVEETHRRGMEFHAWLNPYRVDDSFVSGDYPEVNPASNPSNLLVSTAGKKILNPGLPNVRKFIIDTCMEVVENYDVDAIHFDDYFYIAGINDTSTYNTYNPKGLSVADWRRDQVNQFISGLSTELRAYNRENNKAVQLGISPSGVYKSGGYAPNPTYDANGNLTSPLYSNTTTSFQHYGDYLYADTVKWINEEWIDYIMPQTYWSLELSAASFGALSRWWSFVVRNKNVNLYLGIGIYMAADNGYSSASWKVNTNEVRDQILNSRTHKEVGGVSFYSYNLLTHTSKYIKTGMDLLKNDYYSKHIPGDVKKSLVDKVDNISPASAQITSNVIQITPVKDARGYMIYQVPKGKTLDQNNIDYVYHYGTETSKSIENPANYDYYVSAVNRANVISTPVKAGMGAPDGNYVKQLISSLPATITLEQETIVNDIKASYDKLSQSEKDLVTNYSVLQNAISTIATLKDLKSDLASFLQSVNTHITRNELLPTMSGLTWSYKNDADKDNYDITTGEVKKQFLDTKYVPLIATYTKGSDSYSEEIKINIGVVAANQTGLFYRNDASAMGPNESGSITEGSSKYIGWSGHTLQLENNILFIAKGNYIEVNDSNITEANWSSCAVVVDNKTGSNLTVAQNDVLPSFSKSDSYIIVRANEVIKSGNVASATEAFTLAANDKLVFFRYLDSAGFGDIIFPVTKYQGQQAIIDTPFKESTEDEIVQQINALIAALPAKEDITLKDQAQIMFAYNKYNVASQSVKDKIVGVAELNEKVEIINQLVEAERLLQNAKDAAIESIKNSYSLNDYLTIRHASLALITSDCINSIKSATSTDAVTEILNAALEKVRQVPKADVDIEGHKTMAVETLSTYAVMDNYSKSNQTIISGYITTYTDKITSASTVSDITNIITEFKSKVDSIKTLKQELDAAKDKAIEEAKAYYDSDNYSTTGQAEITSILSSFVANIRSASDISSIESLLTIFKNRVDSVQTLEEELTVIRNAAIARLEAYINTLVKTDYSNLSLEKINAYLEASKTYVNQQTSQSSIDRNIDETIKSIEKLPFFEDEYDEVLDKVLDDLKEAFDNLDYVFPNSGKYKIKLTAAYKAAIDTVEETDKNELISNQKSITEVQIKSINDTTDELNALYIEVSKALNDIKKVDLSISGVSSLTTEYRLKVQNAETVEEVKEYMDEFNNKYDELAKVNSPKFSFNTTTIIIIVVSVIAVITVAGVVTVIIKKRK